MQIANPVNVLERLRREPSEAEWLEFKTSAVAPEDVGEYVSALANGAMLADRDYAFLILGVENETHNIVGTTIRLKNWKVKGENFENWLNRLVEPRLNIELIDFECEEKKLAMIIIEPSYHRPVSFSNVEYIRVGENKKKLKEFPERERSLWLATSRRKFEQAVARSGITPEEIPNLLNCKIAYSLRELLLPDNQDEVIKYLLSEGFIYDSYDGTYSITNLGAILLANDITKFPSVAQKRVRIIRYSGSNKMASDLEQEGVRGYAQGFSGIIKFIIDNTPKKETYVGGVRKIVHDYPEVAIREIVANALIHQDFTIDGTGPTIEIYSDRIEVINPGQSLIELDRILDERRSRNVKLAFMMRQLNLCEERGGGLDKALIAIELQNSPAPTFYSSKDSMKVVIFSPKPFSELSKQDKERAGFFHCVLKWIQQDYMSNASLRRRFSLQDNDYQAVSAVISSLVKSGRIKPADPNQGNRSAKYIPYWA